ncbi:hypothetical protein G647_05108 [Cladophialophora carrionii CBS 160.54]|uniref:Uncharacterized protein n=1 Tax=Cladophialophora carrionii CBS 160.54 TaxID=1279043 RepID=V9DAG5_9EURO|nr:uncharacterized protein G647_05108 [Cladophialophora carrionii CBS 160.54]ETI23308.1 hypothetical protein G647_05108 [Cladophialophora carrionii CBS 160.54]
MPSKFTEILEPGYQTTSPQDDVRLEDIIGAANMSRSRESSEASSRSTSSSSGDSEPVEEKPRRKRLSRLLSGGKK